MPTMPLHQITIIIAAILIVVVLPVFGVFNFYKWLHTKPADRLERRGSGAGLTGALMMGVDQLIRPSAEYRIEAENPVVKEDEEDGE